MLPPVCRRASLTSSCRYIRAVYNLLTSSSPAVQ